MTNKQKTALKLVLWILALTNFSMLFAFCISGGDVSFKNVLFTNGIMLGICGMVFSITYIIYFLNELTK